MANIDSVRALVNQHFQHVTDLGDGILRGERVHNEKPFAVAYIDLSDSVVERSQDLSKFQERLLGPDFFSSENDLRWNSYVYFVAGPRSTASSKFLSAKSLIEGDRHFARKFVLDEKDLVRRLTDNAEDKGHGLVQSADAGATWAELLRSASLAILLEQRPRTAALDLIASGEAFKAEAKQASPSILVKQDALANGLLRKLTIGSFRRVTNGKAFEFGDVNLIVGANGTGKTSILEAIEVLYCGRVRRDPDAPFENIVGEIENELGTRESLKATATIATLKARNMIWYGRTDPQASAITQGFTRFNFLDTDAAFRLSSEESSEQIKNDLGRLLVGPETSKLWTYLSKLADEIGVRLRALDDRLPSERKNIELLSDEVKRLRESPSEASSLLKAFRSSVAQLNPNWSEQDQSTALTPSERTRIEDLSRALNQVLLVFPEAPVNQSTIRQRITRMNEVVRSAKEIRLAYDASVDQATGAANRTAEVRSEHENLENWSRLVEAGIPALVTTLHASEERVVELRAMLREQSTDLQPNLAAEYLQVPIQEALEMLRTRYVESQAHERDAATALSQGLLQGQTLEMLRRDLHDASVAYLERSGEASLCPVCKVSHPPSELLARVEALIAPDGLQVSESLRGNLQNAKVRLEQVRVDLAAIDSLYAYCQSAKRPTTSTVEQLQLDFRQASEELRKASADAQTCQAALTQISLAGLKWQSWGQLRDVVSAKLLHAGADPMDLGVVRQSIQDLQKRVRELADAEINARDSVIEHTRRAIELASRELNAPATGLTPVQAVASMERRLQQAEAAAASVAAIHASLALSDDESLEALQSALEACLLAYDKAKHAIQGEEQSKGALNQKDQELKTATNLFAVDSTARANFVRASEMLDVLVRGYSLDKATADAFNAIKGKVSSIFAQIHSPPEYELGNLVGDQLIVRRDDKKPHAVNQVSTGQRAGLALSIFLALNDSAKTAPPIVLIDDPVAHIDDLNALSFLDYLRDLAVGSRKQIFFATADVRLAALFQRKFDFLGDRRFKKITLVSHDETNA